MVCFNKNSEKFDVILFILNREFFKTAYDFGIEEIIVSYDKKNDKLVPKIKFISDGKTITVEEMSYIVKTDANKFMSVKKDVFEKIYFLEQEDEQSVFMNKEDVVYDYLDKRIY